VESKVFEMPMSKIINNKYLERIQRKVRA